MKKLLCLLPLALSISACGGQAQSAKTDNTQTGFANRVAFESYVAGSLALTSVSCNKTSPTSARCLDPDGNLIIVLCETPEGDNCTIAYKP